MAETRNIKKTTPVAKIAKKAVEPVKVKAPEFKTARYINKNAIISPRKLRLLAKQLKPLAPQVALTQLKFTNTKSARLLITAVQNIISDAKSNYNLDPNTLKFDSIKVDEGMKIKRMDKSHGSRFNRGIIQKRRSRLEIVVSGQVKI